MQYWLLQHNPKLLEPDISNPAGVPRRFDYWHISRYADDLRIGDVVFIWHAGPSRGIYDIAQVISVKRHNPKSQKYVDALKKNDDKKWTNEEKKTQLRQLPTVLVEREYPSKIKRPVLKSELESQGFGTIPVIRMPQRGIYQLEPAFGKRLFDYVLHLK
jgi:predicted RNA-binding protein with PUA-like domain